MLEPRVLHFFLPEGAQLLQFFPCRKSCRLRLQRCQKLTNRQLLWNKVGKQLLYQDPLKSWSGTVLASLQGSQMLVM